VTRLRPVAPSARDLFEIGDAPLCAIAHQRRPPLKRGCDLRITAGLAHSRRAASCFLPFYFVEIYFLHQPTRIPNPANGINPAAGLKSGLILLRLAAVHFVPFWNNLAAKVRHNSLIMTL
jgi:hypothetical protein